jgi:hypothetical protein
MYCIYRKRDGKEEGRDIKRETEREIERKRVTCNKNTEQTDRLKDREREFFS